MNTNRLLKKNASKASFYATQITPPVMNHVSSTAFRLLLLLVMTVAALGNLAANPIQTNDHPDLVLTISGTVSSENGTLPGVSVYLKGTQTGTVTDIEGKFTFPKEVRNGDILVFSFLGYKTREYVITEDTPSVLTITLAEEAILVTGALADNQHPTGIRKLFARIKSIF
ncbi:MAG: carboxypeptidase-like regulatory domain-containing protein [Cyclobacteriaceae bacterium]